MVPEPGIFEVDDPVGAHEVGKGLRAQRLVDLAPDDDLDGFLERREDLECGEHRRCPGQIPHQAVPGGGVEALPNDLREATDQEADGEREREWERAAGQRGHSEEHHQPALGHREESDHVETEPEDVDPPAPDREPAAARDGRLLREDCGCSDDKLPKSYGIVLTSTSAGGFSVSGLGVGCAAGRAAGGQQPGSASTGSRGVASRFSACVPRVNPLRLGGAVSRCERSRPDAAPGAAREGGSTAQTARRTLLALMHEVHTLRRTGVLPSRIRIRWILGFQRRGVRLWEKLTRMPNPGCLPHTSQTAAMSFYLSSLPWDGWV